MSFLRQWTFRNMLWNAWCLARRRWSIPRLTSSSLSDGFDRCSRSLLIRSIILSVGESSPVTYGFTREHGSSSRVVIEPLSSALCGIDSMYGCPRFSSMEPFTTICRRSSGACVSASTRRRNRTRSIHADWLPLTRLHVCCLSTDHCLQLSTNLIDRYAQVFSRGLL